MEEKIDWNNKAIGWKVEENDWLGWNGGWTRSEGRKE